MREAALVAARAGDDALAIRTFQDAAEAYPDDAPLLNSIGNYHAGRGRPGEALDFFDRALVAQPTLHEATLNRAIVLSALGRHREALGLLIANETALSSIDRYWSARANAEAATGDRAAAANSYNRCLARNPDHVRAIAGRAQMALERSEPDMVARFEEATRRSPGDAQLWLGRARALDTCGRLAEATEILVALTDQAPHWSEASEYLAQLRWAAGDHAGFCDHYATAVQRAPNAAVYTSWCRSLAGIDRYADAAAVAAQARRALPGDPDLALIEAIYAGAAGDDAFADTLFAALPPETPGRAIHEARHRLRRNDPAAAERLLERVIADDPDNITAWALRDIGWRLTGDPRHAWLHDRHGLVELIELELSTAQFDACVALLGWLHDIATPPIGQSVRHGTQTRGRLFDRTEPELAVLRTAIDGAVERYHAQLPPRDDRHPLLRRRDTALMLAGSWSIRLAGAGRHVDHIHPEGIASSATYMVVPEDDPGTPGAGFLELGRAPADLRLDLPPIRVIRPRAGYCALFPSTLYHGTRPISHGSRMTVAFDLQPIGD